MRNIRTLIGCAVCTATALALGGCGASGGNPLTPSNTANLAANVLQFAVGTANLYGTSTALNVVVTYRQPEGGFHPGDSGSLLNSPTLTLPAPIAGPAGSAAASFDGCSFAGTGPAPGEVGKSIIGSTTQNPGANCAPGGNGLSTFGQSGGAFGLGIEPFNATGQGDFTPPAPGSTGTPFQVAPYPVPLYDLGTFAAYGGSGTDPNVFVPWGGPPAFQLAGNPDSVVGSTSNNEPAGTAGVSEGIDVFAGIAPVAGGSYSLSVSVPANTGTVTKTASFTLPASLTVLGTATAPAYTPDTAGGGTFAFTMPAGATEAYLQIVDYGPTSGISCNGWASTGTPVYYTIETTSSGTLTLPDTIGPTAPSSLHPNGAAPGTVPSVCTAAQNTAANGGTSTSADQIVIQVIGFDYDAYGISYPNSLGNPSPAFKAAHGETDITISAAACQVGTAACPSGTLPLLRRHYAIMR